MSRPPVQLDTTARQRANRLALAAPHRRPEPQRGPSHATVAGSSEDATQPDVGPLTNAAQLMGLLGFPLGAGGCVPGDLHSWAGAAFIATAALVCGTVAWAVPLSGAQLATAVECATSAVGDMGAASKPARLALGLRLWRCPTWLVSE